MLRSYILLLRPEIKRPVPIARTTGRAVQGVFFGLLRGIGATALVDELHVSNRLPPYTVSPLRGASEYDHERQLVQPDATCWIRFTGIHSKISDLLPEICNGAQSRRIRILNVLFSRITVVFDDRQHPWAGSSDYASMVSEWEEAQADVPKKFGLVFETPTALRVSRSVHGTIAGLNAPGCPPNESKQNVLFPLPALVYRNLQRRWNTYCPESLQIQPPLTQLEWKVRVRGFQLQSEVKNFEEARIRGPLRRARSGAEDSLRVGFVGFCTYEVVPSRLLSDADTRGLQRLTDFAFFAGVGIHTGRGMGQSRRLHDGNFAGYLSSPMPAEAF